MISNRLLAFGNIRERKRRSQQPNPSGKIHRQLRRAVVTRLTKVPEMSRTVPEIAVMLEAMVMVATKAVTGLTEVTEVTEVTETVEMMIGTHGIQPQLRRVRKRRNRRKRNE